MLPPSRPPFGLRLENRLHHDAAQELALLVQGLKAPQAQVNPKYFYDALGCDLFTRLCELPEYYPTRTEAAIFQREWAVMAQALPDRLQWVDLGCGDLHKSNWWLTVLNRAGQAGPRVERLVGVDIAAPFLQSALSAVAAQHPEVACLGVACDFTQPDGLNLHDVLAETPDAAPVMFYPGSSIGNFETAQALALLRTLRAHCGDTGRLLIGVDLVKPREVLRAAYNDAQGLTAAFNLNVLSVVNRSLGAHFEAANFEHLAVFDEVHQRIEMRLVARQAHSVSLGAHGQRRFEAGEHIVTEYSHKHGVESFSDLLTQAGFARSRAWTDPDRWFGVFVAEPL